MLDSTRQERVKMSDKIVSDEFRDSLAGETARIIKDIQNKDNVDERNIYLQALYGMNAFINRNREKPPQSNPSSGFHVTYELRKEKERPDDFDEDEEEYRDEFGKFKELMKCIDDGDLNGVREVIENLNEESTLLEYGIFQQKYFDKAISKKHTEIVKYLISKSDDKDSPYECTPFGYDDIDRIKYIYEEVGITEQRYLNESLRLACGFYGYKQTYADENDNIDLMPVIEYLISKGADPNAYRGNDWEEYEECDFGTAYQEVCERYSDYLKSDPKEDPDYQKDIDLWKGLLIYLHSVGAKMTKDELDEQTDEHWGETVSQKVCDWIKTL